VTDRILIAISVGETALPTLSAAPDGLVRISRVEDDGRRLEQLTEFSVADLLGREGECFRCGMHVTSRVEVAYIDDAERNDCAEDPEMVHEIDEPE
jgi:hypothetical protein